MYFAVFGAALWAFTVFGLALHVADIQSRHKLGNMPLQAYQRTRPIEWLLAAMLLFAATAAVISGVEYQGYKDPNAATTRLHGFASAALIAIALTYIGVRCATWVRWAREEFLSSPGSTVPMEGTVFVDVRAEAERDADHVRRVAWWIYVVDTLPAVLAAFLISKQMREAVPTAVAGAVLGAGIVLALIVGLPRDTEDDGW